jgi:hypothetical protein
MRLIAVLVAALLPGCGSCEAEIDKWKGNLGVGEGKGEGAGPVDPPQETAGWSVEPSETGYAVVRFNHATAIEYQYGFFGAGWEWAHPQVTTGSLEADGSSTFAIVVDKLGLKIDGRMKTIDERTLEVRWDIDASKDVSGIEGGGLDFRLHPNDTLWARGAKKPELDASGFKWPVGGGETLEVAFDGLMGRVYFEKGRAEAIRAFIVGNEIQAGKHTVTMTIKMPESGSVVPSLTQRYGAADPKTWHAGVLSWDGTPIDLSHLNASDRPAGSHGQVRVDGDRLVFADGTPARFWGANVAGGPLSYAEPDVVRAQAKRLAAFGYNLVRIHHHDAWWLRPNVLDPAGGLDETTLGKIDWWVKCLRDEGIYVWIDIHVGRAFTEKDGIRGFPELKTHNNEGRGFNYVNPTIEKKMAEFAKAYLDRKNVHTGTRYVEDPAVIGVLITNENDLSYHGVRFFAPDGGAREHQAMLRTLAQPIAQELRLPERAAQALAQPGPGKVLLVELEARFNKRAVEQVRGFGWKGPVATTNYWGKAPLHTLAPLLLGDIVDTHSYGDPEFLRTSPFFEPNFVTWLAAAQMSGMPVSITEWNVPWPARDRFAAPLFVSSIAALQEWDALTFYVYSQHPIPPPQEPTQWSSLQDPGLMAMMPAAALLYREQHVRAAKQTVRLELPREEIYGKGVSPNTSVALRTTAEQSRLEIAIPDLPELEWDTPRPGREGAVVVTDPNKAAIDANATEVVSDTGELRREWGRGLHTIDTARTQAAQGWIGGETIRLGDVEVQLETPKASVAVSSLDGQPIATSRRMLITVVAQVAPSPGNKFPLLSQPIAGEVRIRNDAQALELVPLYAVKGGDETPVATSREEAIHVITLPNRPTHWYELRAKDGD